jgi:hypothetical protein
VRLFERACCFWRQTAITRKLNRKERFVFELPRIQKRGRTTVVLVAVALLILGFVAALISVALFSRMPSTEPDVFVGVDVAYGDENAVYKVTEAVKGYANLIILGSLNVTTNTTKLVNVCDYLYKNGFHFIVYVASAKVGALPPEGPDPSFFQIAIGRWGDKFLGAYMFDEVGGKQVDNATVKPVPAANTFSDAAIHFILGVEPFLSLYKGGVYYAVPEMKLFTSDYALYWYDYLSGYNVVFGEFVGNQSRQVTVALCRGAAYSQNKEWGVVITSTLCQPGQPQLCLENGSELYNDMVFAWQSGATYIVVFDSPLNSTGSRYGILTQEHFEAIRSFWDYVKSHSRHEKFHADVAYVLPTDYGYGFRGPNDKIWGLWRADALAPKVWSDANSLLATYGMNLDIVYEKSTDNVPTSLPYRTLIFWNGTTIQR